MKYQSDMSLATSYLEKVITEHTNKDEDSWFKKQQEKFSQKPTFVTLVQLFNASSRFIRKDKVQPSEQQKREANAIRVGLQPQKWSLLEFVRVYFLLQLPHEDEEVFLRDLGRLYETCDLEEQLAFYKALPLLPYPSGLINQATQGIRTNISDVFDAIALDNPYPSDFLNQDAWNQMILKAVFMQRPLYRIYGSDKRTNAELSQMLLDFAHERWAANRSVTPELWRFVGPYLTAKQMPDIHRAINGTSLEKQAGLLACYESPLTSFHSLLKKDPEVKKRIKADELNWFEIGKRNHELNQQS